MSRITRDLEKYVARPPALWPGWAPLAVWPAALFLGGGGPRWVFMSILAFSLYLACKWLTWWVEARREEATMGRKAGYLLAWVGMNAPEFLGPKTSFRPGAGEWRQAAAKTGLGVVMVWGAVREIRPSYDLLRGWTGLLGCMLALHFGLFHLLALLWQNAGVNARPVMQAPALAASVSDFWNCRWNRAFNRVVHHYVFRPLVRRMSVGWACLVVFFLSGVVHDLLLSIPAGAGYGWPTGYFLVQGCAVILERSRLGRRLGLRGGGRGRIFMLTVVAGPAFWLFHPPFIRNVILPMLAAIGAIERINPMHTINLTLLLRFAGLLHLGLIWAGLMMPGAVNLRSHLISLPPFIRRLFWTYYTFIGLCLVSFGLITFTYAGTLASGGALARAVCAFLALFWAIRLFAATFVFDVRPYLTNAWRRWGYHATNAVFAFLPVIYVWAAFHK